MFIFTERSLISGCTMSKGIGVADLILKYGTVSLNFGKENRCCLDIWSWLTLLDILMAFLAWIVAIYQHDTLLFEMPLFIGSNDDGWAAVLEVCRFVWLCFFLVCPVVYGMFVGLCGYVYCFWSLLQILGKCNPLWLWLCFCDLFRLLFKIYPFW